MSAASQAGAEAGRGVARALALALGALLLVPTLGYPMGLDQGVFAYLGAEILEGRWPYLETWDHAFPGLAFLHALEIALLGRSVAMFRLFDFAWQLANVALVFAIGARLGGTGGTGAAGPADGAGAARGRAGALLGAGIYALVYQGYGPWNTGQREGFGLLLLLLAFWLWQRRDARPPAATAAAVGLALGAAITIKPTLAAFALAWLPLLRRPDAPSLRLAALAGASALLPTVVFVALYAARGGLVDLYEACIAYQAQVYTERLRGDGPFLAHWLGRLGSLGPQAVAVAFAYAPFLAFGAARRERAMLYLGYLGLVAAVAIQGTFAGYHYLPGLGIGAVLIGSTFSLTAERVLVGRRLVGIDAPLLLAVALVLAAVPVYVEAERVRRALRPELLREPAPDALRIGSVFDYAEDVALARYLRERTAPDERIQVWGHESLVYYLAERDAASRFQTSNPLVTRPSSGVLTPMQQRWRREFLRDVQRHAPRYVVVTGEDHWWWAPGERSSQELLDDFPAWRRWIEEHYVPETRIGRFRVLRRASA